MQTSHNQQHSLVGQGQQRGAANSKSNGAYFKSNKENSLINKQLVDVRRSKEDALNQNSFDKKDIFINRTQSKQESQQYEYIEQDSIGIRDGNEIHNNSIKQQPFAYQQKVNESLLSGIHHQGSQSSSFSLNQNLLQQPIISINNQSIGGNSINQSNKKNETLDSNGNVIRGRKIDSPHLVVVKELRDQEDQEEFTDQNFALNCFSSGSGGIGEEVIMVGKWNTREKKPIANKNNVKAKSRSQERQRKQKQKADLQQQMIANKDLIKQSDKRLQTQLIKQTKNIKSSREIRSSMGFNELLNQLDKDMSIQQSNQVDFKNRTTYELLKLELSGIRRQNSSSGQIQQLLPQQQVNKSSNKQNTRSIEKKKYGLEKSKSKSRERKQEDKGHFAQQERQIKGILKKGSNDQKRSKEQIFQNALNNVINDVTPEKNQGINTTSFLQSEHGRCVTAQGVQLSQQLFQQNGRTLSQQNINSTTYKRHYDNTSASHQYQKDQSSPDRSDQARGAIQGFKPIGNIDKLIRDNIKKIRTKEDEEKHQKQLSEEKMKKKKEQMEQANSMVRKMNKDKTYRKQSSQAYHINNQQSQDFIAPSSTEGGLNFNILKMSKWDQKFKQLKKEAFVQKSSQSQKIEIQKINPNKIISKKPQNVKDHRKSYGLEFIDIKKEIQEELKTLDFKFKNDIIHENVPHFQRNKVLSANNTDFSVKKLRVKQSKELQSKENTMIHEFKSERDIKNDKVVVIKKSKIRKFMKMKKKEKIKEQQIHKKEEILRTIKMHENISKLNEFCKKKIGKNFQKRRNATLQHNEGQGETTVTHIDQSKLSGRRLVFDYSKHNIPSYKDKSGIIVDSNENNDDSSRLSTDFYEEYFRLLNSIKKEQQQNSGEDHSRTDMNPLVDLSTSQNITKSMLIKSPQNKSASALQVSQSLTQKQMGLISPKNKADASKNSHHHGGMKSSLSNNKSGGKSRQKGSKDGATIRIPVAPSMSKQTMASNNTLHHHHNNPMMKSKERAESAPLLVGISSSNLKQASQKKKSKKKKNLQQQQQMITQQQERYIMDQIVKIQRAFRGHLDDKGFYQQSVQTVQQYLSNTSEYQTEIHNHQTQQPISNENPMSSSEQDTIQRITALHEEFKRDLNQSSRDDYPLHQIESGIDDDDEDGVSDNDYDEEEEDDFEEEGNVDRRGNMIIIHRQNVDDDKKVVYLSNINSCSLPQTPKIDDTLNTLSVKNTINQASSIVTIQQEENKPNKVFDYKPGVILEQNQLFSQTSSVNDHVYQSISQKPSLESAQESIHQNIKGAEPLHEEQKQPIDYGMRLMTGSESLLREFKLNTPSQQMKKDDRPIIPPILSGGHNSQTSLQIHDREGHAQSSVIDSKKSNDHTSQSSQSLFERNSFQQFTMNKLQQMTKNNEFMNLIQMREKALEYRQEKESKFIKKMYKNQQLSPRTYNQKKEQLEKWVRLEKEEIKKTKKQFQEEWQKTISMIEETQKNVEIMREKMKIQIDNHKYHQQLFNSQSSRNSSSSYITTQKIDQNRKSILEQEEFQPLSQRSLRLSGISTNNQQEQQRQQQSIQLKNQKHQTEQQNNQQPINKQRAQNEKLIDFLEQSWSKQQEGTKMLDARQGIYIEDQNQIQSSERQNYYDESDISPDKLIKDFNLQRQSHPDDERPLQRSRSEQDLSDLITKNKINIEDLDNFHEQAQEESSFRVLESERENTQQRLILNRVQTDEIKIQENAFEEPSELSSQRDHMNQVQQQQESRGGNNANDLDIQSNDSLLNESELNNYFNEQKFSIEDFKSLDKKKLAEQNHTEEDDLPQAERRDESQIFLDKYDDSIGHQNDDSSGKDIHLFPIQNDTPQQLHTEGVDAEPLYHDINDVMPLHPRSSTPDIQATAFIHHQQMLFQNAKPGENIKIADILKKTQSLTDNISMNSFVNESSNSQIVFQNTQINQSMQMPSLQPLEVNQHSNLAEQLTEEILQHLLLSEVKVPQREPLDSTQSTQASGQPPQQLVASDNQDVFIIDSQYNEKEQRREIVEIKQRMLMENDLMRIENYVNEVINALQQHELYFLQAMQLGQPEINPNFHRQFLQVLTAPIKRNELDMLNQLQTSEIGSYEHFETAQELSQHPILPVDLYLDIERQREELQMGQIYQNGVQDVENESSILQESVHIHNKAIFDALNESLMKFRPYSIQGEPMPWSNKNRRLQTKVDTSQVDTERLFFMVKQDVMRWCQSFSGCHPSHIFAFKRSESELEQFDEEIFQETRERRLAQMLASEVVETEHQWLNYEFEEAQVKIDLSDMILEHLVEEAVVLLNIKMGNPMNE